MAHLQLDLEPLETEALSLHPEHLTPQQYLDFCAANPDVRIERSVSGEIIIMAPAHSRTGIQNAAITAQVTQWAQADGTGLAFDSSAGFDLPDGSNRAPDASWVLKSRLAQLSEEQKQDFLPLCPDFVIELRSQSDRLPALKTKMSEYIQNGARLGWLIDPSDRTVYVYRPNAAEQVQSSPNTISADPELPGFTLDLTPVWNPGL
ncbi:MAG: Uma2 family endonuclease [Acidobacteriota bacterium]